MLALTRKIGDSIVIGSDIEVVVLGIQGEQVKLGINAPKSISILRKEIYQQITEENKQAAAPIVKSLDEIVPKIKRV
jgi:carbon storage regulator